MKKFQLKARKFPKQLFLVALKFLLSNLYELNDRYMTTKAKLTKENFQTFQKSFVINEIFKEIICGHFEIPLNLLIEICTEVSVSKMDKGTRMVKNHFHSLNPVKN